MKYFICGYMNLDNLPELTENYLRDLMVQGNEFLVRKLDGADELIQTCLTDINCSNVTVYSLKNKPDDIPDGWSCKKVKSRMKGNFRPYCHFDDRDLIIAEDADAGIIFWDKKDEMTFLNIVNLLLPGKPVDIILTGEDKIFKAESIDSFKTLLPEKSPEYTKTWDAFPKDLCRKAVNISKCSDVFSECLLNYPASKYSILKMVLNSPSTILAKAKLLEDLSVTDDLFNELIDSLNDEIERKNRGEITNCANTVESVYHSLSRNTFTGHYENFRKAIDELELKDGEYFQLKYMNSYGRKESIAAFLNLKSALNYINKYEKDWRNNAGVWMALEKWKRFDESGRMYCPYTYYLDRNWIVDFSLNQMRSDGLTSFEHSYLSQNPDLSAYIECPTPFNVGDIVRMNCTPFGNVGYSIVLEKKEGNGLRAKVLYYDGKWNIGRLDSCFGCGRAVEPRLSSLYGLSKFEGKLPEEYSLYKTIQDLIDGSEDKAKVILDALLEPDDEFFPCLEENEFYKIMNDKVPGFSMPVNRDDEIILAEFSKQHYIRFSDIHDDSRDMWPYEWGDTDMRIVKEDDYEILMAIQTKDGKDGRLIAWGKKSESVFLASKAVDIIDICGDHGWHAAIGYVTEPDNRRKLKVYYFGGQLMPWCKPDVICCDEPFEIKEWKEAHLEVEENTLFLVLDGERHLYVKDMRYQKHEHELEEDDEDGD